MADSPIPLVSVAQLQSGAFADLTKAFNPQTLQDICIEASRACETETERRLMPFTTTETHRAEGIDPDEFASITGGVPMDIFGVLGASYATALGSAGDFVRHFWVHEHAARYQEFWAYSGVTITLFRSVGGSSVANVLMGPTETGEVWFRLGTFLPIGSRIQATYSGGYSTIPGDLVRAAKYMAAAICARELDPMQAASHGHDAGNLEELAVSWLQPYTRSD